MCTDTNKVNNNDDKKKLITKKALIAVLCIVFGALIMIHVANTDKMNKGGVKGAILAGSLLGFGLWEIGCCIYTAYKK